MIYGAFTRYNYGRGHMFRFDASGNLMAAFDFGWDSTPAIFQHDGTYSIVITDNHYDVGSYCNNFTICPTAPQGPYYITQVDPNMSIEWQFKNTSTDATHHNGFEWCINAPAVDALGNVYANSEDGHLYVLQQGGALAGQIFLNQAIGAAYTPLSLDDRGRIFTENDGRLFVVGK